MIRSPTGKKKKEELPLLLPFLTSWVRLSSWNKGHKRQGPKKALWDGESFATLPDWCSYSYHLTLGVLLKR
jgi:hypothetical protein